MINIDGIDYNEENFTAEQKHLLTQVNNCRAKMQAAQMEFQIAQVAESQFSSALIASVVPVETVQDSNAN